MDPIDANFWSMVDNHGIPAVLLLVFVAFCYRKLPGIIDNAINKIASAIVSHTEAITKLSERIERATGYQREEHARMTECLEILVDKVLLANGHPPSKGKAPD